MFKDLLDLDHPLFWTVDDVLDAKECAALIERVERADAEGEADAATVMTVAGPKLMPRLRNNTRVTFDSFEMAEMLYRRLREHVPESLRGHTVCGVNERIRCYRYRPGEKFGPHYDGSYARSADERSLLTLMIYLNDGFEGGDTAFLDLGEAVTPRPGMALLFQHPILHEGSEVTAGTKYAVRSDVMYRGA